MANVTLEEMLISESSVVELLKSQALRLPLVVVFEHPDIGEVACLGDD